MPEEKVEQDASRIAATAAARMFTGRDRMEAHRL
jgi:hypothetical protein